MNSVEFQNRLFGILKWVLIVFLFLWATFPFYYMIIMSFVTGQELVRNPMTIFPALGNLTLETYQTVLRSKADGGFGFDLFIRNSAIVATGATALTMLFSVPASYALTRLRFAGRKKVSALFLAVYMFPSIIIAVPIFVGFAVLGLGTSLPGLTVVYVALTVPVAVHMLRSYLQGIPESIDEAAYLDGANRWQVVTKIMVPLAMPTIMSTALYSFMIAWNEFLFALLFLQASPDLWTVSLGLQQLDNALEVDRTVLMAGSILLTLPIVVMYGVAERWLTEGLTAGADKG